MYITLIHLENMNGNLYCQKSRKNNSKKEYSLEKVLNMKSVLLLPLIFEATIRKHKAFQASILNCAENSRKYQKINR